ncbi:uncharacterized protein A4U43_C06F9360, partial [Asparagus officinalis]
MEKVADLKAKGVDTIAYVSVDDAFVIKAWKESLNLAPTTSSCSQKATTTSPGLLVSSSNSATSPWALESGPNAMPLGERLRRRESCDPSTGRVADISLRGESPDPILARSGLMTGSLSPALCRLDRLDSLILADWKQVSGPIPSCISSLSFLRHLDLVGNQISGQIPCTLPRNNVLVDQSQSLERRII